MATYEQAIKALRAADAAGNVEDAKRIAQIASRLRGQPAPEQAQPEEGFSFSKMAANIPESAGNLVKDMISPILNPIDTAKGLQTVAQGMVEKVIPKPDAPAGMEWGKTDNEQAVDAVGKYFTDRYGSTENFLKTVQDDPVGAAFDVSGLLTMGGTTAAKAGGKIGAIGKAVETAGKAVDPVNVAINTVKNVGRIIPEALPENLFAQAVKIRPSVKQADRKRIIKTALDESILPTVDGLEKIANRLQSLDSSLEGIITAATNRGVLIDKKVLFGQIKGLKKELGGAKIDASSDLAVVNSVAGEFNRQLTKIKKQKLTPEEVQNLKTDAYKKINFDMSQGQGNFAKNETRKTIARSAKESLEAIDPNIKGINAKMGDLISLHEEMERVVARLDNRNLISLDTAAKIAAGSGVSQLGTMVGTAASVMGAPKIKARIALHLHNIRKNANTASFIQNSLPPAIARQLLVQAERINEGLIKDMGDATANAPIDSGNQ